MDLVYAKFKKVDAEQSQKADREAMGVDKQVPARKDNAGSSAITDANATKTVTGKRCARFGSGFNAEA